MSDLQPTSSETGRPAQNTQGFIIGGAVCAVVALLFLPIVFGPVGAILGFVAYGKGDRRGMWVGIAAIVTTVVGMAIGAAIMADRM